MPDREHDAQQREDALEELRRAERTTAVARIASHIAHEIGTPLNVIAGRAMMIASGETTGEETTQNAKIIVDQANKLTTMIKQFLSEARRPSSREPSMIFPLCERAAALVERKADRGKVIVEMTKPSEEMTVNIEPIKFVQVVCNLLTNAIEAMPQGGKVTVEIKKEDRSPGNDKSRPGSRFVCISVRDEGVGIAEEDIPTIFKLFYSTRSRNNGSGLGLSIAQGIVREHGGWIDVESTLGKGSLFTVCLPEGGAIYAGTHSDRR